MRSRAECVRDRGRCRGRAWIRRCPLTHRPAEGAPPVRQQSARCRVVPLQATRESPAHRSIGLGEHKLVGVVGVERSVQPGAGADLKNPPAGIPQQRPSPAAQACDLTEPEKGVVYQRENPQPCRGRWARRLCGGRRVCHAETVEPAASCAHRSERPSCAGGPFRPIQSSPRRAASATAAVREVRPSLRRMFATWRCTVCGLSTSCSAISRSLNPRATHTMISRSRSDSRTRSGSLMSCGVERSGAALHGTRGQRSRHHHATGSVRCPAAE